MTGIPQIGAKVHVWPMPGLKIHDGPRAVDSGGRFLPPEGRDVIWSDYFLEQLKTGHILLQAPQGTPRAKE